MLWPFKRQRRKSLDQHITEALAVAAPTPPPPVDPAEDVYGPGPGLTVDEQLGWAEALVAWHLPSAMPPHVRPPISPGPSEVERDR